MAHSAYSFFLFGPREGKNYQPNKYWKFTNGVCRLMLSSQQVAGVTKMMRTFGAFPEDTYKQMVAERDGEVDAESNPDSNRKETGDPVQNVEGESLSETTPEGTAAEVEGDAETDSVTEGRGASEKSGEGTEVEGRSDAPVRKQRSSTKTVAKKRGRPKADEFG